MYVCVLYAFQQWKIVKQFNTKLFDNKVFYNWESAEQMVNFAKNKIIWMTEYQNRNEWPYSFVSACDLVVAQLIVLVLKTEYYSLFFENHYWLDSILNL